MFNLQLFVLVLELRALSLQEGLQLLEVGLTLHQLFLSGIHGLLLLGNMLGLLLSLLKQPEQLSPVAVHKTCF